MRRYYGHFSTKHVHVAGKIIILGLTRLEYFDLKTRQLTKWKKYEKR